jgi:SEC-C motif-containing protein
MKKPTSSPCPCGLPLAYTECCGKLHQGAFPDTAEALMRSRYSAYVLRLGNYLLLSWHPQTRPAQLQLDESPQPKWLSLEILRHENQDADHASVEFIARCKVGGRAQRMQEHSRFVRIDGRWLYLDGDQQN